MVITKKIQLRFYKNLSFLFIYFTLFTWVSKSPLKQLLLQYDVTRSDLKKQSLKLYAQLTPWIIVPAESTFNLINIYEIV